MPTDTVSLSHVIADPDCQPPGRISEETVAEYAEAMRAGADFPPVSAKRDGDAYYLWDGFHRLQATQRTGVVAFAGCGRRPARRRCRHG